MKALLSPVLTFLILIIMVSCHQSKTTKISDKIVVTGQIDRSNDNTSPLIAFDKIFSGYEEVSSTMYENGDFRFDIESDIPFDALFIYESSIPILLYPGDSINISIHSDERVTFSGDRMIENQNIQAFLKLYKPLEQRYLKFGKIGLKQSQEEFLITLDSLKNESEYLLEQFVKSNKIDDTGTNTWLNHKITTSYFRELFKYINANQTSVLDKVDEALESRFPIRKNDFINNSALGAFKYEYLYTKILGEIKDEINESNYHRLLLNAICNFKKDNLMRQLLFIEMIYPQLRAYNVDLFEEYLEAKDSIVTDPYLSSKLDSKYKEVKSAIAISKNSKGVFIKDSLKSTKVMLDSILNQNKGKVIYLDLWATWCRPCQQEFKNQDSFKKELEGKNIQFVYICAASPESSSWKATVDQYDLNGINI